MTGRKKVKFSRANETIFLKLSEYMVKSLEGVFEIILLQNSNVQNSMHEPEKIQKKYANIAILKMRRQ